MGDSIIEPLSFLVTFALLHDSTALALFFVGLPYILSPTRVFVSITCIAVLRYLVHLVKSMVMGSDYSREQADAETRVLRFDVRKMKAHMNRMELKAERLEKKYDLERVSSETEMASVFLEAQR